VVNSYKFGTLYKLNMVTYKLNRSHTRHTRDSKTVKYLENNGQVILDIKEN